MYWFIDGIRNTYKISVKFTKGWNLQKLVRNLEFWEFHNGAAEKSVLLGHEAAVPRVSKNCIPSVFKGQNVSVLGLLKYGKRRQYDSSKGREPLTHWSGVMSQKKSHSSSRQVGKYVKQCSWNMCDVQRWWQFSCRYECQVSLIYYLKLVGFHKIDTDFMAILYCWQRMYGEVNSEISGKGKRKNVKK